jgi:hypothetical protein
MQMHKIPAPGGDISAVIQGARLQLEGVIQGNRVAAPELFSSPLTEEHRRLGMRGLEIARAALDAGRRRAYQQSHSDDVSRAA